MLEALAPEPPLLPPGQQAVTSAMAQWADQSLFPTSTPYAFKPEALARMAGDIPQDQAERFLQDRTQMAQSARVRPLGRIAYDHMPAYLALFEAQLAARDHMVGDGPTLADFSVYHCIWFLDRGVPEQLEPYPALRRWFARMTAIGHGQASELDAADAIAISAAATPVTMPTSLQASDNGSALGDTVQISPVDYGHEPTVGELVHLSTDEMVVRRQDPRAGVVHVHFPRVGFQLKPAAP